MLNAPKHVTLYDKKVAQLSRKYLLKHDEIIVDTNRKKISHSPIAKPKIKINKNGEILHQIDVTCRCGEKITINLQYDE